MKNKIVLFYPEDDEGFAWHPFAYHRLAPILAGEGFDPVVIDQRVQENWDQILDQVLDETLWVGFSLISGVMIKYALEVAQRVKKRHPQVMIVFGGWHPTSLPKQTLSHPLVDWIVVGPGETIAGPLSLHLQQKGPKPNRCYDKSDISQLSDEFSGFDVAVPQTRYEWRRGYDMIPDMEHYRSENNIAAIFSAISCPYGKCSFCSIVSMYRYARRETADVLDEMAYLLEERGFDSITFHDGLFFISPKQTMPMVQGFKERGFKMIWKAKARANSLNGFKPADFSLMKETGLHVVPVGLESGSARMLKKMKKGTTPQDAVDLARICRDNDFEIQSTYMSGLPGDTVDDLKLSIEQIEKLRDIHNHFYFSSFFFLPAPGTVAYNEFISSGGQVPRSLEGWSGVKWREPNKINKLHWLSSRERDEFMKIYHDYFDNPNPAKRTSWSHSQNDR